MYWVCEGHCPLHGFPQTHFRESFQSRLCLCLPTGYSVFEDSEYSLDNFCKYRLLPVNVFWLSCKQPCLGFFSFKVYIFFILWILTWRLFEVRGEENLYLTCCLLVLAVGELWNESFGCHFYDSYQSFKIGKTFLSTNLSSKSCSYNFTRWVFLWNY